MQDIAERLKELYDASHYKSWNDLRDDVLMQLGKNFTPTAETIKQMHTPGGSASRRPDPILVATICQLYGEPVQTVSPEIATLLRVLKQRLGRTIDLREHPSTWDYPFGSDDPLKVPLPFDESVVVELNHPKMSESTQDESVALYAMTA